MFLRSFKLLVTSVVAVLLLAGCGNGDPAPAPTGLTVVAAESSVTVSWDVTEGVEYWLFFGPSSVAPASTTSMQSWFGLPGGNVFLKVGSPHVITGLVNGMNYSFSVNARVDGGPGGPGAEAVAATPRIAGSSWSAEAGGPVGSADLHALAFGTIYVGAGAGGAMVSSLDGSSWTVINYATSSNLNAAAFFGTYKVVGDGGAVLTSTDGATWTTQNSGTTKNLYAVTSNGLNLNVAVGAGGTILSSLDGVSWKAATDSATTSDLYAVTYTNYNGGTWLAAGAGGTLIQSTDALTWKVVASNTAVNLRGVAYGLTSLTAGTSTFVAVGDAGTVLTSSNGVDWTAQTLPGAGSVNAVTFGSQFVAVGAGGSIFTSTDGSTWAAAASATTRDLFAVARGPNVYSALGAAGTHLLSR